MPINPTTIEEAHALLVSAIMRDQPRALRALCSPDAQDARVEHLLNTIEAVRAYMAFAIEDTAAHLGVPRNIAVSFDNHLDDAVNDLDGEFTNAMEDA
jgi:hypothetical protein